MLLIFGGTTEGRMAVDVCEQAGQPYYYSTLGDGQEVTLHYGHRLTGAMTSADIRTFCRDHGVRCLIDAAHPFAEGLHDAVIRSEMPVIRVERQPVADLPGIVYCDDFDQALGRLQADEPRLLLILTGVNTLKRLRPYWSSHPAVARILDREESRRVAADAGFPVRHLILTPLTADLQSPLKGSLASGVRTYSNHTKVTPSKVGQGSPGLELSQGRPLLPTVEDEMDVMRRVGCDAIITKQSGESGGLPAKLEAARRLGLRIYVVRPPRLYDEVCDGGKGAVERKRVYGRHGLRRAIESLVPTFFPLRTGFTTGVCATAAMKAACMRLLDGRDARFVSLCLPDGEEVDVAVVETQLTGSRSAYGVVTKDDNGDADVTKGCRIRVDVELTSGSDVEYVRGEGVGRVTLPGLGIPVGGPAINPTPRRMMEAELRLLTNSGARIRVSVEGGEELARRTFNPRVGVVEGISILGTTGIVSPYSTEAFQQSIRRELEVARALGCRAVGLASGRRGEEALLGREASLRVVHYGNFIGAALGFAHELGFERVEVGIMIGKAVKLAEGHLDTHSHKVTMSKDFLKRVARDCGLDATDVIDSLTMARELWDVMPSAYFERIRGLCTEQCRTMFPTGELNIHLICDNPR